VKQREGLDIHESILYYWLTKIKSVYVFITTGIGKMTAIRLVLRNCGERRKPSWR